MMMPANFSAVAENELTYVVGGASLVDYLAPVMTAQNWQNVSANVIKIVGNTFLIGGVWNTVHRAYDKGFHTYDNTQWGAALGILNAGLSIAGGLSAIYTLGSSSIGLEVKEAPSKTLNSGYGFGYKG